MKTSLVFVLLIVTAAESCTAENATSPIDTLRGIGASATDTGEAREALKSLTSGGQSNLLPVLEAFDGVPVLAQNYLRNAFETIAATELKAGRTLPEDRLVGFVTDTSQSPAARRLAYEWLLKQDPELEAQLIPRMLRDPCADFRRDAVAQLIVRANAAASPADAVTLFRQALQGAVHEDQVKTITKALRDVGEEVNLQKHFGFLTEWQIIGPFDNKDMLGFAVAYPPEEKLDLDASYEGQLGEVSWRPISTDHDYGKVDIGEQIENYKGSCMYVTSAYQSAGDQFVEFRLGTQNAWKLWVNGELIFEREEYHRSTRMDQYQVPVQLNAGPNTVLLKICQNEMEQDWAQDYHFQMRVCDATGAAVLPVD